MSGQRPEAAPPTPPPHLPPATPFSQPSRVGVNSPELSPSAGQLLSQASSNDVEGAQAQPDSLSLNEEIEQFEEKYEDLVGYVLVLLKQEGFPLKGSTYTYC